MQKITDRYAVKAMLRLQYLAQDPRLHKEFEIETIGTENRMAPVLSSRAMRTVVGSQMIDMRDILDKGAVLLVNTAGGDAASEIAGICWASSSCGRSCLRQSADATTASP